MNFEHVASNVPGPGANLADFEQEFEGCGCVGKECTVAAGCSCLRANEDNYDTDGLLLHPKMLLECHDGCQCALNERPCRNRIVQLGVQRRMKVVSIPGKGLGVLASERIKAGQFVVEYTGEVISREEAMRRAGDRQQEGHNYIYDINEHVGDECRTTTFIDAERKGNLARYLNHSCAPNLHPQLIRIGRMAPCLALFAARDIEEGEELSYSYGSSPPDQREKSKTKACRCGAPTCTGLLPASEF